MATSTEGLYPLSTQDGKDIPLEVVKAVKLVYYDLSNGIDKQINIPVGSKICVIYSRVDCLLRMENVAFGALAQNTVYTNAIFIPAGLPFTVVVTPGNGYIKPLASGKIYMSYIEQWAALTQPLQSSVG